MCVRTVNVLNFQKYVLTQVMTFRQKTVLHVMCLSIEKVKTFLLKLSLGSMLTRFLTLTLTSLVNISRQFTMKLNVYLVKPTLSEPEQFQRLPIKRLMVMFLLEQRTTTIRFQGLSLNMLLQKLQVQNVLQDNTQAESSLFQKNMMWKTSLQSTSRQMMSTLLERQHTLISTQSMTTY